MCKGLVSQLYQHCSQLVSSQILREYNSSIFPRKDAHPVDLVREIDDSSVILT